jgi:phosphoribosylaminoimidazole-succinocarboxamide synthase
MSYRLHLSTPPKTNNVNTVDGIEYGRAEELSSPEDSTTVIHEYGNKGPSRTVRGVGRRTETDAVHLADISAYLFSYLREFHIQSYFLERLSPTQLRVRKLAMIPLSVDVRNMATGVFCKRHGLPENYDLPLPVIEHYHIRPGAGGSLVNEFHIYALGILTTEELRSINRIASKTNAILRSFFERRGVRLARLGLEFGRYEGQIVLGGELSPRSSEFLMIQKGGKGKPFAAKASQAETYAALRNLVCMNGNGQ